MKHRPVYNIVSFIFLVLAIGYSTGKINLCDVENASCLQSMQLPSKITCLIWSTDIAVSYKSSEDDKTCFQDLSCHYLPKLPQFSKRFVN
jgi:Anaphase-promoting complex subunit 4 WD40 domain